MDKKLCEKLGYKFQDMSLLRQALTHRSYGVENNERLEFLGDALLGFIIAQQLFARYPEMPEGDLSRLRANLVNREVLAGLSEMLGIHQYMHLGPGEVKSGGARRRSILSNSVEALIGAIYLDGGMSACERTVLAWYEDRLKKVDDEGPRKDPKTTLQECLQAQKLPLPSYTILKMGGREHQQIFSVRCQVKGLKISAVGEGTNRRRAEQSAAEKFLVTFRKIYES